MSGRNLFDALRNVDGVRKVDWQTAKYAQGNASPNHFMQQNVLVWSELGAPSQKIEFEIAPH